VVTTLHESLWPGPNEIWTSVGVEGVMVVVEGVGNLPDRQTRTVYYYVLSDDRASGTTPQCMPLDKFVASFLKWRLTRKDERL